MSNADSTKPATAQIQWVPSRVNKVRHDLRNPLGVVLGFCEILEEELTEAGLAQLVVEVRAIAESASNLLHQVNHHLDLKNLNGCQSNLAELQLAVRAHADEMICAADRLGQGGGALAGGGFAADVARIREAAGRMRQIAPTWLAFLTDAEVDEAAVAHSDTRFLAAESETEFAFRPGHETETVFMTPEQIAGGRSQDAGMILIVDDNESNRLLLARRLARQGYTTTPAVDGRQALELLRAQAFDLVLLDIMMPEMDGHEVLAAMRVDESLRHVPVIMISALDDLQNLVRCIQQGAEDYLTKPFDPVLLRARIGACLEKKRLRDREVSHLRAIEDEKQRADELLHVILPHDVAEELKATKKVQPRRHENVAVLFCDIVGFTEFCDHHAPEAVLECLQWHMTAMEDLAAQHGLEKIKTVGDAFMATAGLLTLSQDPGLNAVRCGLAMLGASRSLPAAWKLRVGVHVGPVVSGIVGHRTYLFDIWGDTVNIAARVSSLAAPDSVCVSAQTWMALRSRCAGESCGVMQVKGKGQMELFCVQSVNG